MTAPVLGSADGRESDKAQAVGEELTPIATGAGPRYPEVAVNLTGIDGNAYMIIGVTSAALRRHGVEEDWITYFDTEATADDYPNLIDTVSRWVTVVGDYDN